MKLVFSDKKSGKTSQLELPREGEAALMGKRIGETIEGAVVGLEGYRFQITGLSDKMGTPSRREIEGTRKTYVLLTRGPGIAPAKRGKRVRKLIRGNTVSVDTGQINAVITEYGKKSADELFPKKEKAESKEAEAR